MSDITDYGSSVINDISGRFGLSRDAVEQMARAVANGGGTMAQFNIPELGGNGQWMAGGMTMVGDMFNHGLKAQVDSLCGALSAAMASGAFFMAPQTIAGSAWWPAELGAPASVGGQNTVRYAYFPQACRIAFDPGNGAPVILLDTLNHSIGGFSQQQSAPGDPFVGISFSSQFGQFALSSLPQVGPNMAAQPQTVAAPAEPGPMQSTPQPDPAPVPEQGSASSADIMGMIEKLGALHAAGVLTDAEFSEKKAELLQRL
ncbi:MULTISPECIES: SHOCT domain-containing protein [Tropicimonas]|uniref:Short C-terminal domain-containing protein n=2 Tax=Tropicimonas TaxID=599652 RepID=A0A239LX65_9RHOB|nr:SHOCT domain-containing protein [Tropicimonas sediminicola]SNT35051.1 Short C-terminal domain-containing protein [Tropicimonas sediminicola]